MMNGSIFRTAGKQARMLAALLALTAPVAISAAHSAALEWKPESAVELVATNAPGGGGDRILRIMVNILQGQPQIVTPLNIVNKPGGGGSIAYNYLNQRPGDGHRFVLASKSLLTNNIVGRGPSYTTLTPVAHLFAEYIAVTVRPDSPVASGKDLVERLRKDPEALTFGIATSLGNPNHQGVAVALREAGIDIKKLRSVIFASGGAATTAMLGGHVDVVPISVAFSTDLLRNGQVRLLAVAAPKRLQGALAEVPTWREQGYDAVVSNWRAFVGPKDMTEAQISYWEHAFRQMMDAPEWKKELDANYWQGDFMGGARLRKYLEKDYADARAFLVDIGLVK